MERPMSKNVVTQDTEFLFQFCGVTYRPISSIWLSTFSMAYHINQTLNEIF